jgi:hypothetical protein
MIDGRPILNCFELAVLFAPSVDANKVIRRTAEKLLAYKIFEGAESFLITMRNHPRPYQALISALGVCYD